MVDGRGFADEQCIIFGQTAVILAGDQFDVEPKALACTDERLEGAWIGGRQGVGGIVQDGQVVAAG